MRMLDRRIFLGSSLGGMAAAMTFPFALAANERSRLTDGAASPLPDFAPDTLFLTWQQDPTTTMTIQWVGAEVSFDTSIQSILFLILCVSVSRWLILSFLFQRLAAMLGVIVTGKNSLSNSPVSALKIRTTPSSPPVATCWPSGRNATAKTPAE